MIPDPLTTENLRAVLGARPFRVFDAVSSTQDIARDWALSADPAPHGAAVIADYQHAGRGRQGRTWVAPPGSSLMVSVVLRPTLEPRKVPRLSLVGGLAAAEALSDWQVPGLALKWPNDVLIAGRKVGGVLAEATWDEDRLAAVILGIGLNIRADFSGTELESTAISLEPVIGRSVDRRVILARLLDRVDHWAAASGPALSEAWQNWLVTLGRRVTVSALDGTTFGGVAESVDDDGALVVRLDSGEARRVVAADVTLREDE